MLWPSSSESLISASCRFHLISCETGGDDVVEIPSNPLWNDKGPHVTLTRDGVDWLFLCKAAHVIKGQTLDSMLMCLRLFFRGFLLHFPVIVATLDNLETAVPSRCCWCSLADWISECLIIFLVVDGKVANISVKALLRILADIFSIF